MNLGDPADVGLAHVPARLLATLARSSNALSIRHLARACGVSLARTQFWVGHWADRGVVIQQQAGRALMCSLNREHVMTSSLVTLACARDSMIERTTCEVSGWSIPALNVTAFGSFARGDGSIASDIDLLVIHDATDPVVWNQQLAHSAESLERSFGNTIQWFDYTRSAWADMRTQQDPLTNEVQRDAIHIFGEYLTLVDR